MSDERRQHARVPTDAIVRMHFSTIGEFLQSQAENISTGGMQLTTSQPLAVGDLVGLEFRLTSNYPLIEGTATVKWCRPAGAVFQVGVEFGDLDERSQRVIAEAVRHQERGTTELTDDLLVSPDGPDEIVELPDGAALDVETADLEPVFDVPAVTPPSVPASTPEPWDVEEVVADDLPAAEAFEAEDVGDFGDADWGDVTLDMPDADEAASPAAADGTAASSVEAAETFDFEDLSIGAPQGRSSAAAAGSPPQPGTFDFGTADFTEESIEEAADLGTGAHASNEAPRPDSGAAKPRVISPASGLKSRRALIGVGAVGLLAVALIVWGLLPREEIAEPLAAAPAAAPSPQPRAPKPATDAVAGAAATAAAVGVPAQDMGAPATVPTPAAEPQPKAEPQPSPATKTPAKAAPSSPAPRPEPTKSATGDGASSIVAVRAGSGSTLLTVEGDGSFEGRYRTFALREPARIVVDLKGVSLAKGVRAPAVSGDLSGVRIGRHEDKIRLVLDMRGDTPYTIILDGAQLHVRRR